MAKFSELRQHHSVAKLFDRLNTPSEPTEEAVPDSSTIPPSTRPVFDDQPAAQDEIVTQASGEDSSTLQSAEIETSQPADPPVQDNPSDDNPPDEEQETLWEDALPALPASPRRLQRLLPTTARIGVLGLVAVAMWWTWPRSDEFDSWVHDARAVDVGSLAVVNPANIDANAGVVQAASAITPDATTPAVQFNNITIVTPTSSPSATPESAVLAVSQVTTATTAAPIVLEASTLITDASNGNILIEIPAAATTEPLMPALEDEPLAAKTSGQGDIILLPTATPSPTPQVVAAINSGDIPKVEIVPAIGVRSTATAGAPTPTVTPTDVPSPTPAPIGPGRLWSTFKPLPANEVDHFWFGSPFAGLEANDFSSPSYQFGSTGGNRYRIHHGLDFSDPSGTPVKAGVAGTVVHAGLDDPELLGPYNNFYGNAVVIRLDKQLPVAGGKLDVFVLYGHLSEVKTEVGKHVEPNDLVGLVGMTGIAIGPHLHVEARLGADTYDHSVNPYLWLKPQPGYGAVAVRVLTANGRTWAGARVSIAQFIDGRAVWGRQIETYLDSENIGPDPVWGENGAMGDAPAGSYSLFANINGESIRADFTVKDGATTFVEIRTKQ